MKKKIAISKDTIISTLGVAICLFSLLIVCSSKSGLAFLANGILYAFGFVGFWILIPAIFIFGLYLIIRRKVAHFRLDISLWGIYLIILALLVLASSWGSEGQKVLTESGEAVLSMFKTGTNEELGLPYVTMTFNTAAGFLGQFINPNGVERAGLLISNTQLGGGYVGYVLCGALNSATTSIGTTIISWAVILIGLLMVINRQIKKLFSYLKSGKQRKAAIADLYKSEENIPEELTFNEHSSYMSSQPVQQPLNNNSDLSNLTSRNYNNTHGLQKPVFSMDDEETEIERPNQLYQTNPFMEDNPFGAKEEPVATSNAQANTQAQVSVSEAPAKDDEPDFSELIPAFGKISDESPFESEEEKALNEVESSPIEEEPSIAFEKPAEEVKEVVPNAQLNAQAQVSVSQASVQTQPNLVKPEIITDPTHRPQPKATIKPPYHLPPTDLLQYHESAEDLTKNDSSCEERTQLLNQIFADLHVGAEVVGHVIGPSVTRYNIKTKENVSVNIISKYVNDISIRLGGVLARFEPIVIGQCTSGLEIENEIRTNVGLRESIEKLPSEEKYIYDIPFGKNISGELVHASIKDFPHMLVAGTSGSGKSIFMHSCILSLIMRTTPYQLKLVLVDPKKVEMNYYKDIPHLLCPIISEPRKALVALRKLVDEMQRRYNLLEENRVRDIKDFNKFAAKNGIEPLPYIVVFIDEYADLNDDCKEIREPVVRLAQKARSAGIHLVIATQRPSVNVIDGVIKSNLNTKVALMVANATDSSVIIGEGGAEKLLGNGDMIIDCSAIARSSKPRVQGCFVESDEINAVCDYIRGQCSPQYDPEFLDLTDHSEEEQQMSGGPEIIVDTAALKEATEEQLYTQIVSDLSSKEYCSISFIQRTYGVGFPKAGRLFAKLQKEGYVALTGDARGSKVLVHESQSESPTSIDESRLYADNSGNLDDNQGEDIPQNKDDTPQY